MVAPLMTLNFEHAPETPEIPNPESGSFEAEKPAVTSRGNEPTVNLNESIGTVPPQIPHVEDKSDKELSETPITNPKESLTSLADNLERDLLEGVENSKPPHESD